MPFAPRFVVALSVLGVVALAGCGAPPEGSEKTGSSDEALVEPINPHPTPVPVETILTGALPGTPGPQSTICGSYDVPAPITLADYECTAGVEFWFPGDLVDTAWAFACRGNLTNVPSDLGMTGWTPSSGPEREPGWEADYTTSSPDFDSACFGAARPGWTLVIDVYNNGGSPHGGCPSTGCNTQ
jgi:hypothetical protein